MFENILDFKKYLLQTSHSKRDYFVQPFIHKIKGWDLKDTFATDGDYIYVNVNTANEWSPQEAYGVFTHEVLHILYQHTTRFRTRDKDEHKLYNIAEDIVINEKLLSANRTLPENLCTREVFDIPKTATTTSEIYKILKKRREEEYEKYKEAFKDLEEQIKEQEEADKAAESLSGSGNDDSETQEGDSDGEGQPINDKPEEVKDSKETSKPKKGTGIEDAIKKSEEILKTQNRKLFPQEEETNTLYHQAPKIKWLPFVINEVGKTVADIRNQSYKAINRRQFDDDVIKKGVIYETPVPTVRFYVDVSGSMNDYPTKIYRDLQKGLDWLKRVRAKFYAFADDVSEIDIKNPSSPPGYGTNITKVIEHINSSTDGVELVILITDCQDTFDLNTLKVKSVVVTNNKDIQVKIPHKKYFIDFGSEL